MTNQDRPIKLTGEWSAKKRKRNQGGERRINMKQDTAEQLDETINSVVTNSSKITQETDEVTKLKQEIAKLKQERNKWKAKAKSAYSYWFRSF